MAQGDQSNRRFRAGFAGTIHGNQIEVLADAEAGTVELDLGEGTLVLNLGHLEQFDNAIRRALIWLAIHPAAERVQ